LKYVEDMLMMVENRESFVLEVHKNNSLHATVYY